MTILEITTYVIGNQDLPGIFIKKYYTDQTLISIKQKDQEIKIDRRVIDNLITVLKEFQA